MENGLTWGHDLNGSRYVEWDRGAGGWARAWIKHRPADKDWAGAERYLNAARIEQPGGGPRGNSLDYPIWNNLSDDDILRAFVTSVSAIVGNPLASTKDVSLAA
jgi:hypothetical protein